MASRRQVLLGLGAEVAVVAVGVATHLGTGTAAAQNDADRPLHFTYRGHSVMVTVSGDRAMAMIDGRKMIHLERSRLQRLHSHLLPFQEYTGPRKLMTDLIDIQAAGLVVL